MRRKSLAMLGVAGVLAACGGARAIHDQAASGPAGSCHMDGTGIWAAPDRSAGCTPGQWISDPDLSTAHVCGHGYNPRPGTDVSGPLKRKTISLYGEPQSVSSSVEADHYFPRWLGGDTTLANFWPEPNFDQPNGFDHNPKDIEEFAVYKLVCQKRTMTVPEARKVFEGDWRDGYRRFVGPTP